MPSPKPSEDYDHTPFLLLIHLVLHQILARIYYTLLHSRQWCIYNYGEHCQQGGISDPDLSLKHFTAYVELCARAKDNSTKDTGLY